MIGNAASIVGLLFSLPSILFSYYFAFMKVYALCTLHETGWGTRVGVGEPEKASEEAEVDEIHPGHFTPPIQSSPRIIKTHSQRPSFSSHQPRPSISRPSLSGASNGLKSSEQEEMEMKPVAF